MSKSTGVGFFTCRHIIYLLVILNNTVIANTVNIVTTILIFHVLNIMVIGNSPIPVSRPLLPIQKETFIFLVWFPVVFIYTYFLVYWILHCRPEILYICVKIHTTNIETFIFINKRVRAVFKKQLQLQSAVSPQNSASYLH